jgi:quinol monooxygenase YgiN
MIQEIARLDIKPDDVAAFEAGAAQAAPLFERGAGCRALRLQKSHEVPGRYWLLIEWDSVEAHLAFRETEEFAEWRRLVGGFFADLPVVEHGIPTGIHFGSGI